MLLSVSHFRGEREKNFSPDGNLFCGASRIAGFGEGTPQQVSFFRQYDAGTGLCCPLAAAFSLSAKDTFQRPPATRWTGIFQNFFCLSNPGNRILATGGAENFSFHSPHHRVLKFAKRNGQFPLCFLLRTKIQNAKRRGKKISLSLTTTIRTRQNGRKRSRATKKQ